MEKDIIFNGCATALITPFSNGKIDYRCFEKLIDFQLKNNITALVVCGTTGECSTLSIKEKCELLKIAVRKCKGNIPIIFGVGSNDTKQCIKLSYIGDKYGADALLSVTPFYNKTNQDGLYHHYAEIAKSVS